MTDLDELKYCISDMFYAMGRSCMNVSDDIRKNPDKYTESDFLYKQTGFELNYHGWKYQLKLELKEVLEEK